MLATQLPVASFDSIFPCAPTVPRLPPAAGHQRTRASTSTSCRTASGRPGGSRTGTSRLRVAGHEPVGRGAPGVAGVRWYEIRRDGTARTRSTSRGPTPRRRRAPLDGPHRPGQERQHGPRLQRRQRHAPCTPASATPAARRRSARPDDARRGHDHQRHRRSDGRRTPAGATTPR